jgi:hypothetical protein
MADKPAPIALNPVKSSSVAAVGYDRAGLRFGVQFKSGATYHYGDVDAKTAEAILAAESVGSAVSQHLVKSQRPFVRLGKDE